LFSERNPTGRHVFECRSLSTGSSLAPRDLWPRLLSVDIYPPGATYKANAG
jgi:hypothetical protein